MTIGFFTPQGEVSENVIIYLKEKLMGLFHRDNQIDDADVVFRNQPFSPGHDHICEVTLSISGEILIVHRSSPNYVQAAREVVAELTMKVEEFMQRQKELPDLVTSTVKV